MSRIITSDLNSHFSEIKKEQLALSNKANYEPKIATKGLLKEAGLTKSASAVVTTQGASYYHPLYEPTNLQLPTKMREICVKPDTLITMHNGIKQRIDEINIGDWIIDKNGNKGQVEDVIINDFEGDIFEIKIRTIKKKLIITGNHNVFVIKKNNAHCINKGEKIKFCQQNGSKYCKRYSNCNGKNIKEIKCKVEELEIGDFFLSPILKENKLFNNVSRWNSNRRFFWNNYIALDIQKIEKKYYKGKVYNLTIATEHSYIANDVAVSNCQWGRYWTRTEPIVHNAINLHSEFPMTGFRNVCDDPYIQKFYDNLTFDVLKLPTFLSFFSLEYWKLGNVFSMGIWNDNKGYWDRFLTLNPDYVEIEKNMFSDQSILRLDPDDALKKIVQNKAPINIYNKLDPKIIEYVSRGMKVPLSNFVIEVYANNKTIDKVYIPQVTHISNSTSMYEAYGLPFYFCVFKVLMYKDILRRAQFAIARRHWKPIKVVKVGDETHHATNETLNDVRDALDQASADPNSWFIWHNYINFDYIASAGHVMPLNEDLNWVNKELYAGMGVNEAILTGGGVSFSNASVALRILINRYSRFQKIVSNWVYEYIYKPVARVQQFYKINDKGEQELIIPKIDWEMMRLQDDAQQKNLYSQLQQKGLISKKTFLTYLGLDYQKEQELIKSEKKEDLVNTKETQNDTKNLKNVLPKEKEKKVSNVSEGQEPLSLEPPSPNEELPVSGKEEMNEETTTLQTVV